MISEFISSYPRTAIILIGFIISFFITLINFLVLDKDKMKAMRERQKELQEKLKQHKDDPAKAMEINKEMFSHMGENFRHSLKPMLITFIPIIVVFHWVRGEFAGTTIQATWFWYYFVTAIISSLIFRKIFKLP